MGLSVVASLGAVVINDLVAESPAASVVHGAVGDPHPWCAAGTAGTRAEGTRIAADRSADLAVAAGAFTKGRDPDSGGTLSAAVVRSAVERAEEPSPSVAPADAADAADAAVPAAFTASASPRASLVPGPGRAARSRGEIGRRNRRVCGRRDAVDG